MSITRRILVAAVLVTLTPLALLSQQEATTVGAPRPAAFRVGKWLPTDQDHIDRWLSALIEETEHSNRPLAPAVKAFKETIEGDPEIYMLFHQMFSQVPRRPPYNQDPTGQPQVRDYERMLRLMNRIITTAPEFNKTGLVGFPVNAILDWPMGTPAGTSAFLNRKVNRSLKALLGEWATFLRSSDSQYVLGDDPTTGWFGKDAMAAMPDFARDFQCDPKLPYYGFSSWDDFFTRKFRDGVRPVEKPGDDGVIANACESAPYRIATDVSLRDRFWIKAQPYSLQHMMASDPLVDEFVGGTIYQAFLSALSYHRWHSPVSGRIVKTRVVDGSYYAAALAEGFDPASPNDSQAYITEVASRALVFIQADDPRIGLMAVLFVGMAEVSSNEFTVYEGQHVKKGDQLGMFHFGGSTHCLIFRPEVRLKFDLRGQTPGLDTQNIPVRSRIATVGR